MEPTKDKNFEKTSIDMATFNSTANLMTNAGFQSTLTLDSKGALAEKEELYSPFEHREHEHATSTTGALVHLLKSSLGSGLLAMPVAFKNAGLAVGTIGTLLVGIICTHCVHILVATSHDLCAVARVPSMGFAETCGAAFTHGPAPLRRYANAVHTFVDYALMSTYLGASCVYVVFIGASFKEVIDVYAPETSPSLAVYCSLCLVPLVLIAQIRNLKWLVPFSAVANLFLVTTFAITLYYVFRDLPPTKDRALYSEMSNFPLFISTVIFAMEGIGVVMPLENEMASPQHFLGCPGVLNSAMGVVTGLYTIVGFVGYLKYGDSVKGSITLNLPQDEIVSQCAKILMALAILFTYGLQFYVPMEIIWRRANASISPRYHNIAQISIRTVIIICSVALAAAFPDLELFISLVGAIFFSTLGLLTPAVVQTVHCWHRSLGPFNYIIIKNVILSVVSMVALVSGSYYSIAKMIEKF